MHFGAYTHAALGTKLCIGAPGAQCCSACAQTRRWRHGPPVRRGSEDSAWHRSSSAEASFWAVKLRQSQVLRPGPALARSSWGTGIDQCVAASSRGISALCCVLLNTEPSWPPRKQSESVNHCLLPGTPGLTVDAHVAASVTVCLAIHAQLFAAVT
jgi:hypothetical protein